MSMIILTLPDELLTRLDPIPYAGAPARPTAQHQQPVGDA